MAYWIHENGETIGPLRAIEILERAQPETLVSQGQEWVPLREHPHFRSQYVEQPFVSSFDQIARGVPGRIAGGAQEIPKPLLTSTDGETKYWILPPGAQNPLGPFPHGEVVRRRSKNLRVSRGDNWVLFGEHPDFRRSGADADNIPKRHLSLIMLVFGSLGILLLFIAVIGVVGFMTLTGTPSDSKTGSQTPSNYYGPGPCGESWEEALQGARAVRAYNEGTGSSTFPGHEFGLVNSLIVDPSIEKLSADKRAVCSALALEVGRILTKSNGTVYLEKGLFLGNYNCAIELSRHYFNNRSYQNAYIYAYRGQKADQNMANQMMELAASNLTPYQYQIVRQHCEKNY